MSKAHNKNLAGKKFLDLEPDLRQKILDYQFSVQVFPSTAEDSDILQIFARLNATGLKLNKQELRNSEYFGEFKTASYILAAEHLNFWRKAKLFSEDQIARMLEVEFTSEILIFILKGITGGNANTISKFYKDYNSEFIQRDEVENRYRFLIKAVDAFLEEGDAYSMFSKRIVAYAVSACIYNQIYGLGSSLEKGKPKGISSDYQKKILKKLKAFYEGNAPEDILEIASRRTTHLGSRKAIFDFFNAS